MRAHAPGGRWLTLAEASELLGVHRATLRQWADAGKVRAFRTPGGHRRFLASEVDRLIASAGGAPAGPAGEWSQALITRARQELSDLRGPEGTWLAAFPAPERGSWRESGRRLIGLAIQYVSRHRGQEAVLAEGRSIAVHYGQECAAHGLGVTDTVRAFLFFRESLLRAARPGLMAKGQYDEEDARIHRQMREFLDEALFAALDAYQQAMPPRQLEAL